MITRFVLPAVEAVLLLSSILAVDATTVPGTCYLPNGQTASAHKPCYSSTGDGHSHCCNPVSEVCLDNGLCWSEENTNAGFLYRDSCTDKTWRATSCPSVCLQTYENSACPIVGILDPNQDPTFCCLSFNITSGQCYGETISSYTAGKVIANWGPLAAASASSTGSATASVNTGTATLSSLATNTTPTPTLTNTGKSNAAIADEHDAAIGAGVGVPLGLLLLASLAALFFQHRRHKKQLAQWQDASVQGTAGGGGMAYPLVDPKTTYQHAGQGGYRDATPGHAQQPSYELPNIERRELE